MTRAMTYTEDSGKASRSPPSSRRHENRLKKRKTERNIRSAVQLQEKTLLALRFGFSPTRTPM